MASLAEVWHYQARQELSVDSEKEAERDRA